MTESRSSQGVSELVGHGSLLCGCRLLLQVDDMQGC